MINVDRLSFLLIMSLFFACSGTSADIGEVKGEKVMRHVEKIISYGPHPPGSEAQKKVGAYLSAELKSYGLDVHTQKFQAVTPFGTLEMTNIWGIAKGKRDRAIILASHYDSKYFTRFQFVGANDGGSSSSLLLELARLLSKRNPTDYTVWFVFFDGEEAIQEWTSADSLYGSRQFVRILKNRDELRQVTALILLDMIGEKDLLLRKDAASTEWLNQLIWKKAAELGYGHIFTQSGSTAVQDDHLPFAEENIPVVDIIDMEYAYHHGPGDTIDKLSSKNIEIVGNVVLASLPDISKYLSRANEQTPARRHKRINE